MVKVSFELPDEWVEEANDRDISNTEYVRRMVRAGRRQFGMDYESYETPADPNTLKHDETAGSDIEETLKKWIEANLSTSNPQEIADLVDLLEDDFKGLISELMKDGKARYEPEEGYLTEVNDE